MTRPAGAHYEADRQACFGMGAEGVRIILPLVFSLGAWLAVPATIFAAESASPPSTEQISRELRKAFLVASSLPPAKKGYRKEHIQFLRQSTAFIKSLSSEEDSDRPFLIAARASRGMLLLHCGNLPKAREDFDEAIALYELMIETHGARPDLPVGTPELELLRLSRAFTFINEGVDRFREEIESLPDATAAAGQDVLKERAKMMAKSLADRGRYDDAIALYGIIKKFSLWDPDVDQDPQRLIEILRIQKQNTGGL